MEVLEDEPVSALQMDIRWHAVNHPAPSCYWHAISILNLLACFQHANLHPKPELAIPNSSWGVGYRSCHELALHAEVQLWKLQPGSLSRQGTLDGEKE